MAWHRDHTCPLKIIDRAILLSNKNPSKDYENEFLGIDEPADEVVRMVMPALNVNGHCPRQVSFARARGWYLLRMWSPFKVNAQNLKPSSCPCHPGMTFDNTTL